MDALSCFTADGRLEIDNNTAERSIRPLALGRKNYLFAGSDQGGERAAILYTLITTAKLNGLDPEAWLADVIRRIGDHPASRIEELLLWRYATRQTATSRLEIGVRPKIGGHLRCGHRRTLTHDPRDRFARPIFAPGRAAQRFVPLRLEEPHGQGLAGGLHRTRKNPAGGACGVFRNLGCGDRI